MSRMYCTQVVCEVPHLFVQSEIVPIISFIVLLVSVMHRQLWKGEVGAEAQPVLRRESVSGEMSREL